MEDGEDGEDEDKGKVVVGFSEVSVESVALVMALETRTAEELAQDEVVEGAPEAVGTAMAVEGYTRPVLAKWGAVSGSNVGIASKSRGISKQCAFSRPAMCNDSAGQATWKLTFRLVRQCNGHEAQYSDNKLHYSFRVFQSSFTRHSRYNVGFQSGRETRLRGAFSFLARTKVSTWYWGEREKQRKNQGKRGNWR